MRPAWRNLQLRHVNPENRLTPPLLATCRGRPHGKSPRHPLRHVHAAEKPLPCGKWKSRAPNHLSQPLCSACRSKRSAPRPRHERSLPQSLQRHRRQSANHHQRRQPSRLRHGPRRRRLRKGKSPRSRPPARPNRHLNAPAPRRRGCPLRRVSSRRPNSKPTPRSRRGPAVRSRDKWLSPRTLPWKNRNRPEADSCVRPGERSWRWLPRFWRLPS